MNPLLSDKATKNSLRMRVDNLKNALKMLPFIIFVSFMQAGPARMMKRKFKKQMDQGETIWLDDLEPHRSLPPSQQRPADERMSADMTPNHSVRPCKSRAIKLDAYP